MDKVIGPVTPARAFWTVILVCFGLAFGVPLLVTCCIVLWTAIFQHNPDQTMSYALIALPLMSAFTGILFLVVNYLAALIAAALLAAFLAGKYGMVPCWPFLGASPAYGALILAQDILIEPFHWYSDLPKEIERYEADYSFYLMALKLAVLFVPALICCWWYLRRYEVHFIRDMNSTSTLRRQ